MKKFYLLVAVFSCVLMSLVPHEVMSMECSGRTELLDDGLYYGTRSCGKDLGNIDVYVEGANENILSGEIVVKDYVTLNIDDYTYYHKVIGIDEESMIYIHTPFSLVLPSTMTSIKDHAFQGSDGLTAIKLNPELGSIGIGAFLHCTGLKSINISPKTHYIREKTFQGCTSLPSIILPAVEEIWSDAFNGCTSLVSVNAGNVACPVKYINGGAFCDCKNLRIVHLASKSLLYIGTGAFSGCSSLETFRIPSSVTNIAEWAFSESGLKVLYNDSKTPQPIVANVFDGVNLSNTVLYVPKGCKAAYMAADVWKNFGAILEPGEQPDPKYIVATGVQKIGTLYYDLHVDRTATLVKDADYSELKDITIPETVNYGGNTYAVIDIRGDVFNGCTKLTSVKIGNSITELPANMFEGCTNLTTVTFPSSLTSIGKQTFYQCTALKAINLPATLTHLGESAFEECSAIASEVRIPGGVDTIPYACFSKCVNIPEIKLGKGIKVIEDRAFQGGKYTSLTIPSSVIFIGGWSGCSNMQSVRCEGTTPPKLDSYTFTGLVKDLDLYVPGGSKNVYRMAAIWQNFRNIYEKGIPEKIQYGDLFYQLREDFTAYLTYESNDASNYSYLSGEVTVSEKVRYNGMYYAVTEIGTNAFKDAKGITTINLPKSIKEIGGKAFYDCTQLNEVNIPSTVQILANDAFEGTKLFTNNTDGNGAVYYDGCLLALTKDLPATYAVKEGTRLIATSVFDNQPVVTLTLPEGMQYLCNGALSEMANLKTIYLPKTLMMIGGSFLHNCYVLTDIYNYSPSPYDLSDVYCFDGLNQSACTLHVPHGTKSAYEDAVMWQDFNIVEMEAEYTVEFLDYDYTSLKVETVKEGESAHAPEASEREGYHFVGWDKDITNIMSNRRVIPEYEINTYTVNFYDGNDNNLSTQIVDYGDSAEEPEEPELSGYTFIGWDKEFSIVKEDMDIRPRFIENAKIWTVTYIDNDNYGRTELYKELVEDGHAAQGFPAAHEGYKLWYWLDDDTWEHADLSNITRDMTVQAYYTEITFHVTYRVNGVQTFEINAVYGYDINKIYYPYGTPTRESTEACDYVFKGWTPDVTFLTQDVTLEAVFEAVPHTYTISWLNDDGSLLDKTTVEYGDIPLHPDESKAQTAEYTYSFVGWTPEVVSATQDASYKAVFEPSKNRYTVTWLNEDESLLGNTVVEYGVVPTHEAVSKAGTEEYSYVFKGWSPEVSAVIGDATYKAVFEQVKNSYAIRWLDEDGSLIQQTEVEYGAVPTHEDAEKANTAEYTYTFTGWIPEPIAVSGQATYVAKFNAERNRYTVTWLNEDESLIAKTEVAYGVVPLQADPTKESTEDRSFTFAGWSPEVSAVTGDATYKATFETHDFPFRVTYLDKDDAALKNEGLVLHLPDAPEVEGFTFYKWMVVEGTVEEGIVIRATYTANEPTGVGQIPTNMVQCAKVLQDGVVYVLTDDNIYTVQGQKVH